MWRPTSHRGCSRSLGRGDTKSISPFTGPGCRRPSALATRQSFSVGERRCDGRPALPDARFRSSYKRDLLARRPSLDGLNPTHTRRWRFSGPMTDVLCKLSFAEFFEKNRIRRKRSLADFYQRCGRTTAEWPQFKTATVRDRPKVGETSREKWSFKQPLYPVASRALPEASRSRLQRDEDQHAADNGDVLQQLRDHRLVCGHRSEPMPRAPPGGETSMLAQL